MNFTVLNAKELTTGHWARWKELQAAHANLDSPYFSADFTRIAGEVKDDVFVAVIGSASSPDGFFPFHRGKLRFGQPVGSRLSDFHGIVGAPDLKVEIPDLMKACGLASWEFHALIASQPAFAAHHEKTVDSHFLDTSEGVKGYEEARRRAGSDQPRRLRSYRRKAQEKFGRVEFVPHVTDPAILDTLLEWKSRQYQESGGMDNWSFEWMRDFVHRIHAHQGEDFSGVLSALYFDGELAAAHMGMRSRTAWHWWIPRHNTDKFADFRPGLMILHYMIEHAPEFGVRRIDLGYGDEEYKLRLRSGGIPVASGRIEMPSFAGSLRRWRENLESWVRRSPLMPVVRYPGRVIKGLERWNRYR